MTELVQPINSDVAAYYETEKILQKVSEAQASKASSRNGIPVTDKADPD